MAEEAASPTDEQIAATVEAANKRMGAVKFWRSDRLGVLFGYDERWKQVNPSQKSTAVVVTWRLEKDDTVMASRYLVAAIGRFSPRQVHENARSIVDAYLRDSRLYDADARLVRWRPAMQNNYPVVYIERDASVSNLNGVFRFRLYSVVTSWRGHEIDMECGSSIPLTMPELTGAVEGPIQKVLGSLQFVRK